MLNEKQLKIFSEFFDEVPSAEVALNKNDLEELYKLVGSDYVDTFAREFACIQGIVCSYLTDLLMSAGIDVIDYFTNKTTLPIGCFYDCEAINDSNINRLVANKEIIPAFCFCRCDNLTNVKLTNTISLGEDAFHQCKKLSKIDLGVIKHLGIHCLDSCGDLRELSLPISIYYIGEGALGYDTSDVYYDGTCEDFRNILNAKFEAIFDLGTRVRCSDGVADIKSEYKRN